MQAVILVGGKGTRLLPLTKDKVPKPMIKVQGKPFLLHLITQFKNQGFKQFVFCTGHLGHIIQNFFGEGKKFGMDIKYSTEDRPLGSGGAIKNAEMLLEDNFLLINGDDFFNIDYGKFFDFHIKNNALITMALKKIGKPDEFHAVLLNKDNVVTSYFGRKYKKESNAKFSGYFAINKELLSSITKNKFVSIEFDILTQVLGTGRVYGFLSRGALFDIGSPQGYYKFRKWTAAKVSMKNE